MTVMTRKASVVDRIVSATLDLAAEKGWRRATLAAIAERAGLSLAELHAEFPDRAAILGAYLDGIDRRVLAARPEAGDSPRDRLFDVIMRRLDALTPRKAAILAILRDAPFDPAGSLLLAPRLGRSLAWMLEAAGLASSGLRGLARLQGLAAVYAVTLRVWARDDSPDMARTMATLDRALRRAEGLAELCDRIAPRPAGNAA
jgi:AcrR family transcriptional regulator